MIAAAALAAGCDRLWSEEMQHGLIIENQLRIENPFP
jgi:predicted nucleic acid-binding protein